jgi:putative membrane protein
MIYYEPNKNWFRDIRHLTTSWTIKKIFSGVAIIGIFSTVICLLLYYFRIDSGINWSVFSLLGIVLSILLVFRTNTAYERWWEGRKQWGSLVNNTRSLAINLHAALPKGNDGDRLFFARHISNFCIALKDHLRDGVKVNELIDLDPLETVHLNKAEHKPNLIAYWIYERIQQIYLNKDLTDADLLNIKSHHHAMVDILGACERIKRTPIPFSYAVYIKVYITLYGLMLPIGLFPDFGFYAVLLTMFIFFAMIGVELMAQEIEDPFGLDCNDLPTGDIAATIRKNVFELLENKHPLETIPRKLYTKVF